MENSIHYRPTQAMSILKRFETNIRNLKKYLGSETVSHCGCESRWLWTWRSGSGSGCF